MSSAPSDPAAFLLRGPLTWTVAWRFLRGTRSRLLEGTARAALLSTALGVTAMVIAMALMTGYRRDLESKLIRGNAAIVAYPVGGEGVPIETRRIRALAAVHGVTVVGQVAYGQGSISSPAAPAGLEVTLRGVDPGVGQLSATREALATDGHGLPGAVLGTALAQRLDVVPGTVLRLVVLGFAGGRPHFHYLSVRVTSLFTTGFAEFDRSWVVLDRRLVERVMGTSAGADLIELSVRRLDDVPRIVAAASKILDPDFVVTDWQELNRELFTALRLQQVALFLVLGLIVLVSTFNVASTLVVLVRERLRDIGVLGALGLDPSRLRRIFLVYGTALGTVGTLLGVAAGWSVSWILTTFHIIRFDPDVAAIYFISSVPFHVVPRDLLAVMGFALFITFLACWVPAWRAARIDPSAALRYE
jgi:lipoprotein-releasing system permease protein